jgi:hypothetical protein
MSETVCWRDHNFSPNSRRASYRTDNTAPRKLVTRDKLYFDTDLSKPSVELWQEEIFPLFIITGRLARGSSGKKLACNSVHRSLFDVGTCTLQKPLYILNIYQLLALLVLVSSFKIVD